MTEIKAKFLHHAKNCGIRFNVYALRPSVVGAQRISRDGYPCPFCPTPTTKNSVKQLLRHIDKHHKPLWKKKSVSKRKVKTRWFIEGLNKRFTTAAKVNAYKNKHKKHYYAPVYNQKTDVAIVHYEYVCLRCSKKFPSFEKLYAHLDEELGISGGRYFVEIEESAVEPLGYYVDVSNYGGVEYRIFAKDVESVIDIERMSTINDILNYVDTTEVGLCNTQEEFDKKVDTLWKKRQT
jgi:hypothetical protein